LLVMDENPLDDLKKLGDKKLIRAVFQDGSCLPSSRAMPTPGPLSPATA